MNNDYGMMARAFGNRGGGMQRQQGNAGPYGGIMAGQPQRPAPQMGQMQRPPQLNPIPGMPPRPGMGTTQNPGGIMPPHMQQPRPMQMGVPQQQNPISLAPGGMMRRPM